MFYQPRINKKFIITCLIGCYQAYLKTQKVNDCGKMLHFGIQEILVK